MILKTFARARVLVVGSGRMGKIRAGIVHANPRFELCGIVDPDVASGRSLSSTYAVKPYPSLEDALSDTNSVNRLDGLIICSPTYTHDSVIKMAASQSISVFTEKPVDETAEKIASLFALASTAGIALCCGFQRRFDPSYVAAREAVQTGAIGSAIAANIFFADHPVPSKEFLMTGGNIFMDLSAHDVDYITNTLQDDVVSVYASGTSSDKDLAKVGVHDNATMVMNFQKGAVATLFMSRSASYGYDQRCEIFGSEGLVTVGNIHAHAAVISNQSGIHLARLQHSFPQRFKEAFAMELDAFADVLLSGALWPVAAEQCVKVQRVADAARLSVKTGTVVNIE